MREQTSDIVLVDNHELKHPGKQTLVATNNVFIFAAVSRGLIV